MCSKRRLFIGGTVVVLAAVFCLVTVGMWKVLTAPPVGEIPPEKAKQLFKMVTANVLPEPVEELRAIFWDSRDPAIFVRFKTDADGIAYIREVFGGAHAESYMLDEDALRRQEEAGWRPFWQLQNAEERWGIPRLFDMGSLKSAIWLRRMVNSDPGVHATFRECDILIDTKNSVVYIWAICIWGTRGGKN